jgi:hypothetical protein
MEVGWVQLDFAPGDDGAQAARQRLSEIRDEIRAAGDFDAVADKYAARPGGEYRAFKRGHRFRLAPSSRGSTLPASVLLLPAGSSSDPVVYPADGVGYVFHVYRRVESRLLEFEEAAPLVDDELWAAKYLDQLAQFQNQVLGEADIAYDEATVGDMVGRATGQGAVTAEGKASGKARASG